MSDRGSRKRGRRKVAVDVPGAALYPDAAAPELTPEVYANPTAVYRGAPFWAWNCKLERGRILRQLDALARMGLGGGHIHSRTGLATPYMGEEFMGHVRACVDHAAAHGLKIWLYDEDRWPSGFAGGLVTRDAALRMRSLVFSPEPLPVGAEREASESVARYTRGVTHLLARYAVRIDGGVMTSHRRLADGDAAGEGESVWYAYNVVSGNSSWFNHQAYVDTLNPAAIERFRDVTHEAYRRVVGDAFGKVIHAIFTDEPQVVHQRMLNTSSDRDNAIFPWTDDLPATYAAAWGEDLLALLPELVFEPAGGVQPPVRWRFRDHVAERFATAFADTLGRWCEQAGIALTGHMMAEATLESQSHCIMEAMRHYRSFQLPGIDMLCDAMELTTAKQAQSAARQDGRPGVLSELYGVTNWDFPFEGHKRQGDWQAALGVTMRCHHLTWLSMAGNSKRDYPASMGPHVPWYTEYPLIENHFARLNTILTRGRPRARVAVVHPIENYWLARGPSGQCRDELKAQEERFQQIVRWLLHGLVDFDFLCESRLPGQGARVRDGKLQVGAMAYEAVIVPGLRTIRSTTCDLLRKLGRAGGRVIWAGRVPDHVDGLPDARAARLAKGRTCAFTAADILPLLDFCRDVDAVDHTGARPDDLLYQMREEGARRHLFVCCVRDTAAGTRAPTCHLRVRGRWHVVLNDTQAGERRPADYRHADGWTEVAFTRRRAAGLCVTLEPVAEAVTRPLPALPVWRECGRLQDPVDVVLHEPNALLLDRAAHRLAGETEWQAEDELLRVTNTVRARLGWPSNHGGVAQPWVEPPDARTAAVELRFRIDCEAPVAAPKLVLERASEAVIALDGRPVDAGVDGWWVDEDLPTVPLPALSAGRHELVVRLPLTPTTTFEWAYLLGDFGVRMNGRYATVTAPVKQLGWGDMALQGLPFYGGTVTYRARIAHAGGPLALRVPFVGGAVTTVDVDGRRAGAIAFDPYRLVLGEMAAGEHALDVTVHGTRVNAFGALHNCSPHTRWWGPDAWQSAGEGWDDGYRLRKTGVLVAPIVETH